MDTSALKDRDHLWHYTTWGTFEKILKASPRSLWASHVSFLNDSAEVRYAFELFPKMATKKAGHRIVPLTDIIIWDVQMFIASFSRDSDSLSQWRAYGGGEIQVAIGFDRALLGAVATKYGYELKKCIYKEGDQELALKSIVESFDPDYLAN